MITATIKQKSQVFFGPSLTIYPAIGSVFPGEIVSALHTEGADWCAIEYAVLNSTQKKRGYVPTATVSQFSAPLTNKVWQRISMQASADVDVLAGPSPLIYPAIGTIGNKESVILLERAGDFSYIEYALTGSLQKKRGYVSSAKLLSPTSSIATPVAATASTKSSGSMDALLQTVLADFSKNTFYGSGSFYGQFKGQCTWYCWGRAFEKCGKQLRFTGSNNGGQWFSNVNAEKSGVQKRTAEQGPVSNSICSCAASTAAGHVLFIEHVDGDAMYYTEANVGGKDGALKKASVSTFMSRRKIYGYLVL